MLPLADITLGGILAFLLVGLIVGALGRLIVPGRTSLGILGTILVGIGGAFLGGLATEYLVSPKEGWVNVLLAVLGAALLVSIFGRPSRRG